METVFALICQPWLGSILGILGLGAAVFFYLRSRRISRLAFQHDVVTLLGGSQAIFPDEIQISFSGVRVPNVTSGRIVLWNAGNTTLDASQIVVADPLRVELGSGSILLKATILKTSRKANACLLVPREGRIADIRFDFLDPGDGMTFEILHSGRSKDLNILGTLRGIPSGVKNFGRARWNAERRMKRLPFPFNLGYRLPLLMIIFIGAICTGFGLFRPQLIEMFPNIPRELQPMSSGRSWVFVFGGMLYAALPLGMLWLRRKRYPASLEVEMPEKNESHANT